MAPRRRRRRPWYRTRAYRLTRTVALTVALAVGGVWWSQDEEPSGAAATGAAAAPGSTAVKASRTTDARPAPPRTARRPAPATRPAAPPPRPLARARPTRVVIPYIGVDAPVIGLGLDRDHRLTAPPEGDARQVGWYRDGPSPGERGTAVLVGHLDTDTGPAVFAGLGELTPGHLVELRRADGRTAVYTVDAVKSYEKAHFPDREVYGARGRPELRLITCGGAYDRRTGYTGNTVVFAHFTAVRGPDPTR
ncbi:class F sortase [Streptomyces sp. NPDC005648]|uniref:class F sortase n=1 Tax=Streptomyces sp. NPDC005648 TaxID=3157044 RepID=UPI0033A9AF23